MMIGMLQITKPTNHGSRLYRWKHPMPEFAKDFNYVAAVVFGLEFRWWKIRKIAAGDTITHTKKEADRG